MLILFLLALVLIGDVMLFAFDKFIWSFVVFAGTIAGAYYYIPEFTSYVGLYNWFDILIYGLPAYLGLGAVTAAIKWIAFSHSISSDLTDAKEDFQAKYKGLDPKATVTIATDNSVDPALFGTKAPTPQVVPKFTENDITTHRRVAFLKHVDTTIGLDKLMRRIVSFSNAVASDLSKEEALVDLFTPRTRHYIDRITFWVLQWPIVLIAFILEDLLVKFGRWVARMLDAVFNRMSRMMIGKSVKGL